MKKGNSEGQDSAPRSGRERERDSAEPTEEIVVGSEMATEMAAESAARTRPEGEPEAESKVVVAEPPIEVAAAVEPEETTEPTSGDAGIA